MTAAPTTPAPTAPAPTGQTSRPGTASFPTLLRADAALCAVTGLLAAVAASPVAELLGPDVAPGVVRVVGVALLVYAADLALAARAPARWLRRFLVVAGVGNLAWEVATICLVVVGAFSVAGAVVALAVAAVVGGLGVLQLRAARRG